MWPFKKKCKETAEDTKGVLKSEDVAVANGIDWRRILSEGKTVELFDGCRAKCDGTFEDL